MTQRQLKLIGKRQQAGQAVLPLLEAYMVDLACDDPGTVLGPQLILPMLRTRLMARAQKFGCQKAFHDQLQVIVFKHTYLLSSTLLYLSQTL